jgi:hypothetical protein
MRDSVLFFFEVMETGNAILCYNRGGQNDLLADNKKIFLGN